MVMRVQHVEIQRRRVAMLRPVQIPALDEGIVQLVAGGLQNQIIFAALAVFAMFMAAVSGLDWDACHALLEERVPGVTAQSVADADTFFGVELPSLAEWTLSAEQAASIRVPVLSVLGSDTLPLWIEVAAYLRSNMPRIEEHTIDGAGHLLHIQRPDPVARAIATFLKRHAMGSKS